MSQSCGLLVRKHRVQSWYASKRFGPISLSYSPSISFCYLSEKKKGKERESRTNLPRANISFLSRAAAVLREVAKYSEMRAKAKFSRNVPSNYYKKARRISAASLVASLFAKDKLQISTILDQERNSNIIINKRPDTFYAEFMQY